jgi:hypothetical protein
MSTPRCCVLAPPGHTKPLHRRPRRSPPNRRAARRAGVHASLCHPTPSSTPTSSCRAAVHAPVRPRHAFSGRLSCAGEVTTTVQACRATPRRARAARTLAPVELGQAMGRARCAGRGRAGPGWAAHALRRPAVPALCNWAERGFGPVAFDYIFIFSEYIQFFANSKICVGFI